jgi:hypothetical protein
MGNDLISESEDSFSMCNYIFMNMGGRDFKGIVPLRGDVIIDNVSEIHLDVEHQHVEMQ